MKMRIKNGRFGGKSDFGSHTIADFYRCERKFWFDCEDGDIEREPVLFQDEHFVLGSLVHALVAKYWLDRLDQRYVEAHGDFDVDAELARIAGPNEHLVIRARELFALWKAQPKRDWIPILVEREFELENGITARPDLVMIWRGKTWFDDLKTGKHMSLGPSEAFNLQAALNSLLVRMFVKQEDLPPFGGFIYDRISTAENPKVRLTWYEQPVSREHMRIARDLSQCARRETLKGQRDPMALPPSGFVTGACFECQHSEKCKKGRK